MKAILLAILRGILTSILQNVTPAIRELIAGFVKDLWKRAQATDNKADNQFVKALAQVLKIKLSE